MGIKFAKFPEGLRITDPKEVLTKPLQAMMDRQVDVELLAEGEYDITPQQWTHHKYIYNLLVNENGTGTMRMIPRSADAVTLEGNSDTDEIILRRGGRIHPIPPATPIPLMQPLKDFMGVSVDAFVLYVPGRSPRRTIVTPKKQ